MKNYDNVESKDYERYMQKGIITFWAIDNNFWDHSKLLELSKKYNYVMMTCKNINVYEMAKRGATFDDLTKQMKNENLSILLESGE